MWSPCLYTSMTHTKPIETRGTLGQWGEDAATAYLRGIGYAIIDRNWRTRTGELDIIAFDASRDAIVAVEVKTRRGNSLGTPEESITPRKLSRIRRLLAEWLLATGKRATNIAVDVIALTLVTPQQFAINHLKDVS